MFPLLLLAGAIAWLWRRVDALEREVARLRADAWVAEAARPAADSPPAEPQRASAGPTFIASVSALTERATSWRPRFDFEDVFGRMLPIWAGGITLAVAGFFLVRWSIDAGLLTPRVRVVLAGLFGIGLIAGAEAAYRWRDRVADPRVAQALAGAGLATLYAAFYLAGSAYGLIGQGVAFAGLAGVTGAAIVLSYRFGLPSAVLGLVGGFAAPALVGSDEANLPLLTLYLALVTAGLALTGRRQDRAWLGMASLAGGLGWGALLIAGGTIGSQDIAVLGVYLVLLGGILPAVAGGGSGRPHWLLRVGAAGIGALQLAALVQQGGFGLLEWAMYLLLGAALAWFGWREAAMREGNAVAGLVGAALLVFWPDPAPGAFAFVAAALAAIFAGVPLAQLGRGHGRSLDTAQVGGIALATGLAALWQFGVMLPQAGEPAMAAALFALACLPAAAAALARVSPDAQHGRWTLAAQAAAALLAGGALAQVFPRDMLAWAFALAAAGLAWRARGLAGALAALAAMAALWAVAPVFEWLRSGALALVGTPMQVSDLPAARIAALHILPAAAGGAAWFFAAAREGYSQRAAGVLAVAVGAIAGHIFFRHAFAVLAGDIFVAAGVIARAVWQTALVGAAWLAWHRGWRRAAAGLAAAAAAHFAWFSVLLHNPLWSAQAVGAPPLANALVPAYAAGLAAILTLRHWAPRAATPVRWLLDGAIMAVAALFALSLLRQLYAGSLLMAVPIGEGEDLIRSLLGIVLAVGFLLWGARTGERSWRIGSLVLMVVAVLKVFLVDAAGLGGLARIASFMALGFSLIGIGWFYTRQLRAPEPPAAAA